MRATIRTTTTPTNTGAPLLALAARATSFGEEVAKRAWGPLVVVGVAPTAGLGAQGGGLGPATAGAL
jgi:hypothetical protein